MAVLMNPAQATEEAPATFEARFETSKGAFVLEIHRDWAPRGADRFYNLCRNGFFNDARFFRVISRFMVQFGINGNPAVNAKWKSARIQDDPVTQTNERGNISFATSGPNSRTTQVFINFGNNARLDGMGFAPFGKIIEGMDVVDSLYSRYGEGAPSGRGPSQGLLQSQGNAYLEQSFPELDHVKHVTLSE